MCPEVFSSTLRISPSTMPNVPAGCWSGRLHDLSSIDSRRTFSRFRRIFPGMVAAASSSEGAAKAGVQPIIGCQLSVDLEDCFGEKRGGNGHQPDLPAIVVLAADDAAQANNRQVIDRAFVPVTGVPETEIRRNGGATLGDQLNTLPGDDAVVCEVRL